MAEPIQILIADDEASLRLLVKATLQNDSYLIDEAADGKEALAKIAESKPQILILDIMMPGLSGFEVCEQIKGDESLKDIIVIMLTAKGKQTDKDWAKSVGADHFFTKPFSPIELIDLVEKVTKDLSAA